MGKIFGSQKKFATWRKLWLALAESQKELGLAITNEQIEKIIASQVKEAIEKVTSKLLPQIAEKVIKEEIKG